MKRAANNGVEWLLRLYVGQVLLGVRDVGLFEHAIPMFADEEVRDMLLERQFRGFLLPGHGHSSGALSFFGFLPVNCL